MMATEALLCVCVKPWGKEGGREGGGCCLNSPALIDRAGGEGWGGGG